MRRIRRAEFFQRDHGCPGACSGEAIKRKFHVYSSFISCVWREFVRGSVVTALIQGAWESPSVLITPFADRKSAVKGKCVSVVVGLGGRRISKKKKQTIT